MIKFWTIDHINPAEMICMLIDDQNQPEEEHTHEFIEIEYVLSGSGIQIINGIEYSVCKGDLLFFNINDRHSYYPTDKMSIVNCIFYPSFIEKSVYDLSSAAEDKIPPVISFSGGKILEIEKFITDMIEEYKNKTPGYLTVLKSYLYILLVKLLREVDNKTDKSRKVLLGALDYIERNYAYISASDVAYFYSYNPSYFSKMFKESIGVNLTEYINNRRMNEAIRLVKDSDYSIEHICNMIGYKDKKHFYKLFKKATGVTPSMLREKKK